jgi:hypothetical protein
LAARLGGFVVPPAFAGRLATRSAAIVRPLAQWGAALLLALIVLCRPGLQAAQLIQYLQVPASGPASLPQTYNLPNYGNVQVSITGTTATYFDQINGYNQSAGPYFWGTDTQRFGIVERTAELFDELQFLERGA